MKKIIQLKESEYKKLFEKANYNEKQIEKKGKEYYEEYGVHKINIEIRIDDDPTQQNIELKSNGYFSFKNDDKFPIREGDKRDAVFVARRCAEKLFGNHLKVGFHRIEKLREEIEAYKRVRKLFVIATITGWLVALLFFIIIMATK